ncbi:MAG: peptidylprolyl isomerase [Gemmatimonadetes bacterium]|nr:peptidylprolyl isomerase [Gemmatimonadota bacterium]
MERQARDGDTVHVHYTGKLRDGTVFDSSREREPLEFEVGAGQVIPGFDRAVAGMTVGQRKEVVIPADQAYGEQRSELQVRVPRDQIPEGVEPAVGQVFGVQVGPGQEATARVAEVAPDHIVLDLNHPLAGEELRFDIELVDIEGQ